jgi:hypothetical protein
VLTKTGSLTRTGLLINKPMDPMTRLRSLIGEIPDYVGGVCFWEHRNKLLACGSPAECRAAFLEVWEDMYESARGDERVSNLRKALGIPLPYRPFPGHWGAS